MTNYYTYTEEIRDEDVPNEIVLKKHTLPQLPEEIISMILYKFGGLQHKVVPTLRMVRELAFKTHEETKHMGVIFVALRGIYTHNCGIESGILVNPSHNSRWIGMTHALDIFTMNTITDGDKEGKMFREEDYTYSNWDTYDCRTKTVNCRKFIGGGYVNYKDATAEQIFQNLGINYCKWGRHLVSKEMSVKQLKQLLDMNDIPYTKSATKKKLLQLWYGF